MKAYTLNAPKARDIKARRKRERKDAAAALTLAIALTVYGLAGISLANGNPRALIYLAIALAACVPPLIYLNRRDPR